MKNLKEIHDNQTVRAFELYMKFLQHHKEDIVNQDRVALALYIYEKAYKDGLLYGAYQNEINKGNTTGYEELENKIKEMCNEAGVNPEELNYDNILSNLEKDIKNK